MDQLQTRLEALEQQIHAVNRQLRWWRGLACGLAVVGLLSWGLPLGLAREDGREKDTDQNGLAQRVAALEDLLKHFSREKSEVFITGANLHIRNGLGSTDCFDEQVNEIPDCPNALGNLIVGYNEPFVLGENIRTGSHNVVVGEGHSFSRYGGIVVGRFNTISGVIAAVIGGEFNTASGFAAAVSGGASNTASGGWSTVSGGQSNTASGNFASVSGGGFNPLTEEGAGNTASGDVSSVSGGSGNTAVGAFSSVSGGRNRTAEGAFNWVAGSLFEDE